MPIDRLFRTPASVNFFIVSGSIIAAAALFGFFGRDNGVNKFLFTADVSDVAESTNFFGRVTSLSFVLNNYPYSLEGIIKYYDKIAEENGWRINNGRNFNFNEGRHRIEASKDSHDLVIDLERLGGKDRVQIKISYD